MKIRVIKKIIVLIIKIYTCIGINRIWRHRKDNRSFNKKIIVYRFISRLLPIPICQASVVAFLSDKLLSRNDPIVVTILDVLILSVV